MRLEVYRVKTNLSETAGEALEMQRLDILEQYRLKQPALYATAEAAVRYSALEQAADTVVISYEITGDGQNGRA